MKPNCDARCGENMDYCAKWGVEHMKCKPSTLDWCDTCLQKCDVDRMCRKSSIFGNLYFYITDEDIKALKNGKILFHVDEYGIFIGYKKGEETNDKI